MRPTCYSLHAIPTFFDGTPLALLETMQWPRRPVEQIPHQQFRPPHCPRPECSQHRSNSGFRYKKDGSFTRSGDGRRVARFICKSCGKGFSQQTFACSYYAKRPRLLPPIAAALNAGCGHRQIGRTFGCSHSTVGRRAAQLGRHSLLFNSLAIEEIGEIREALVADHFETFVSSQIDALGIGTVVGHDSWYVYGVDPAPHRRGGRITPAQRRKLAKRKKSAPSRGSVVRSFKRMLDVIAGAVPPGAGITLISDAHKAYPKAVEKHRLAKQICHLVFPNPPRGPKGSPPSPEARARDRAMFPVDQLHALWRHSCAHHRRETIAFGRRINAMMERAHLMVVWKNFVKWRSERKPDRTTPAMRLGLTDRPWSWRRVFARRLFPTRQWVPPPWMKVYRRDWDDDGAGQFIRHRLKHAF
jgi:transposase-like protein